MNRLKKLGQKILSLLLIGGIFLSISPMNVFAEEQMNTDGDVNNEVVEEQPLAGDSKSIDLSIPYQYDVSSYIAFTDHSFDGELYYRGGGYNETVKLCIDDVDFSDNVVLDDSFASFSIPNEDIKALYVKGKTHKLSIYEYSGDRILAHSDFDLRIENPYVVVDTTSGINLRKEFVIGSMQTYSLKSAIELNMYNWKNPIRPYYKSVDVSKSELVNVASTSDVFSLVNKDYYMEIHAINLGTAKLNVYYDVPEGYDDDNNGLISIDLESKEEVISASIGSSIGYNGTATAGSEISLTASLYLSSNEYISSIENERPVKSYDWKVTSGDSDKISLSTNKTDQTKCTVNISKDTKPQDFEITFSFNYIDLNGIEQIGIAKYPFKVENRYMFIECSTPEKMELGDTYVVNPELVDYRDGERTVLKYEQVEAEADDPSIFDVKSNTDGTVSIYKKKDEAGYIHIKMKYKGDWASKLIYINSFSNALCFVYTQTRFDGISSKRLCLDTSRMESKYDSIKLFTNIDGNRKLIDSNNYTSRVVNGAIYFDISAAYINSMSEINNLPIVAVAFNGNREIVQSDEYKLNTAISGTDFVDLVIQKRVSLGITNIVNRLNGVSDNDGFLPYYMNRVCEINSIVSQNSNIIKVEEQDDCWTYTGVSEGTTQITVNYSEYYEGKMINKSFSKNVTVNRYDYHISAMSTESGKLFAGGTYYYDLKTYRFDRLNGTNVEEPGVSYNYKVLVPDTKMDIKAQVIDGKKLKVVVGKDSPSGNFTINLEARKSNDNLVSSFRMWLNISKEKSYEATFEYLEEDDDRCTVIPKLLCYTKQYPDGMDVSSEYDMTIDFEEGNDIVSCTKNADGSYTLVQNENSEEGVVFIWKEKNASKDDKPMAKGYIWFYEEEPDEPVLPENPEITKGVSLSILDSEKLDLKLFFNFKNVSCDYIRYTLNGEVSQTRYTKIGFTSDNKEWSRQAVIGINSGEITRSIKVELVKYDGTVINEFTVSAESYIKEILTSNNAEYNKYKPMLKALLNYGAASQLYFGYCTDELANRSLSESDKKVNNVPSSVIYRYNLIKKMNIPGLTYCGASLAVGDNITVRQYFKLEPDRDISNYEFWICIESKKDEDRETKEYYTVNPVPKDGMYYVEMTGPLKSFFRNMELRISSGYAYEHLYYSPLNYISKVYNTDSVDPKLKSFVDAMYWFQYQKQQLNQ